MELKIKNKEYWFNWEEYKKKREFQKLLESGCTNLEAYKIFTKKRNKKLI